MKQTKIMQTGILALVFAMTMAACGGKAKAQSSGAEAAKSAAKDAAGKAVSAVKGAASGGKPAEASDFIYQLNTARNGVVITGIQKDAKFGAHLVVPAEIEGYPVVGYLVKSDQLDNGGHSDSNARARKQPPLESVVFPDSITYMTQNLRSDDSYVGKRYGFGSDHEDYGSQGKFMFKWCSFENCNSLKSIVFPKNLKIAPYLRGLPSLTAEGITWPEELEVMRGFGNDTTTEVVIPDGVKIIMDGAFSGLKNLTTITIPDSVEEILGGAFAACPQLTTVNLPAHPINYHGGAFNAFNSCPKLGIAAQKAIKDSGYTGGF
jgi:hypothetical protein